MTAIVTMETSAQEKLEVKCENDQYMIKYEEDLQLHLKQKNDCTITDPTLRQLNLTEKAPKTLSSILVWLI